MAVFTEWRARLASVCLSVVLFILGLCIIIPISLTMVSAGGRCLLYAETGSYGASSLCSYSLAIATICHLMLCAARATFTVVALQGVWGKQYLKHKFFLFACAGLDVICCLLTMVSGGVISRGFAVMCSDVFSPHSDKCGSVDIYLPATSSFLKDYYLRLSVAEVGVWLGWVCWLLMLLVDIFLLWKTRLLPSVALPFALPLSSSSSASSVSNSSKPSSKRRRQTERDVSSSQSGTETGTLDRALHQPVTSFSGLSRHATGGVGRGSARGGPSTPPPSRPVPPRPQPSV